MPIIKQQLSLTGLSNDTIDVIMASWRKSTSKQYNTYLTRWVAYCREQDIHVGEATIQDGLGFLTSLHKQGLGFSAINTARSALSSVMTLGDKTTFGEHPLVVRFLKGIFELKPSMPRYSVVWDVGTVFDYFLSMPVLEDLTLKQLTLKLTMLLALTTAQRCQTLACLDIELMQVMPDRIRFTLKEKLKTTRPGSHLEPIEVTAFPQEPRLCPVRHIEQYITRTQNHRQSSKLLLSFIKPYKQVTTSSIGRWIKSTLSEAGIDEEQFSAHSSRTASSSYGLQSGLTIQDILKAGGWTRAGTFAKHYNKPISSNFGTHILNHFNHTNSD